MIHTSPTLTYNPEQRLTVREVAALLSLGISTVWAMAGDGRLPRPERWGRCTRWRFGDIVDHLEERRAN